MATDATRVTTVAGLVTAALAAVTIFGLVSIAPNQADQSAASAPTTLVQDGATTSSHPQPTAVVTITTPPPVLDGLTESVARILSTSGFASELGADDIASQLPESVYRTLVAHEVVLTVATDGEGQ